MDILFDTIQFVSWQILKNFYLYVILLILFYSTALLYFFSLILLDILPLSTHLIYIHFLLNVHVVPMVYHLDLRF